MSERSDSFFYLDNETRQAGLMAWAEYEATGLHLTAKEVDEWMSMLEEGINRDPPKYHT